MKHIKLTPFKKILMSLLTVMLNATYHTNVSAYDIIVTTDPNCHSLCTRNGYAFGHPLNCINVISIELGSGLVSYYNNSTQRCLCLNTAENTARINCGAAKACSTNGVSNTSSGLRYHVLVTDNKVSCAAGYGNCYCKPGYYARNQSCVYCSVGYECSGGVKLVPLGMTYTAGQSACTAGYYQPSTTASQCISCPAGSYNNAIAQSYCNPCSTGFYNSKSAATLCTPCPTLNSVVGTTIGSGTKDITSCFISSGMTFTEANTGHKYQFTANCYYVS